MVFAVVAADLHVYAVELEEKELVGHYLEAAELCHEVVNDGDLRQKEGGALGGGYLLEGTAQEELGAVVVEDDKDAVGVARMLTEYLRCYIVEEAIHWRACSRVSGLPTSSHRSGEC